MAAYVMVAGFAAWARFAGYGPAELTGVGLIGAGAFVLAGAVLAWNIDTPQQPGRAVAAGAMVGMVAAWSWQPCVGRHLGEVLTGLDRAPGSNLAPMMVYVAGTSLVLIAVALAPVAIPGLTSIRDAAATRHAGLGLGIVLALLMAVGVYDDMVAELFRISAW